VGRRSGRPVITGTLQRGDVASLGRLDAWYYLAPGAGAARRLDKAKVAGLKTVRLGGDGGLGKAWMPGRLKQAPAAPGEDSRPYIKPHDLFQYLPGTHAELSTRKTKKIDDYAVESGWLLQTRSGRNLGLNALVDDDLARYVVSDDLIRVHVEDARMRYYATAFLRSRTGHGLLRRDKSGSVIDHVSPQQVEALEVPLAPEDVIDAVSSLMERSFERRQECRRVLRDAIAAYEAQLPVVERPTPLSAGWSVRSNSVKKRLDAASYDPLVAEVREQLLKVGGVRLDSVADARKPPGRYKTIYVGPGHGLPFMSGTQILQYAFSKPQYMAPRAFKDVEAYKLQQGWSTYMADGRSEKNLGVPAMVVSTREGWIASGHVGRLVPRPGTHPGWLWLAARTWHFAVQIKSLASGSVVDSTFPDDAASIVLPPYLDTDGDAVIAAWEGFAEAQNLEVEAIMLLDAALADISGVGDEELEIEPAEDVTNAEANEDEDDTTNAE
jgi:hypothetical protein